MKAWIVLLALMLPAWSHAALSVFACEPEWAALTHELAGDRVSVFTATTAQQDPHHVEARPSLIAKMRNADVLVCTGADLEVGWLPLLRRRSANPNVQTQQPGYFEAAMMVERLGIPESLDRAHGDVHAAGNPHVHLDPHRMATIAKALSQRLAQLDPSGAAEYQQRLAQFESSWQALIAEWETAAAPLKGARIVVLHEDWLYFNRWLGIDQVATIEPKPGVPPSAADQKRLLDTLSAQPPAMIVVSAYQNDKAARWLASKLSVPVVKLPFTVGGDAQSDSLSALFERTIALLLAAQAS